MQTLDAVAAARGERARSRRAQHVARLAGNRLQRKLPADVEARNALEESERVRVARLREELVRRAGLDERACVHDVDAFAHPRDDAQVMGDQDECGTALHDEGAEKVQDLRLDRDVERRCGLVGDKELRLARERHCDHRSLAHAARELVRVVAGPSLRARDPDLLEQLDHADVGLPGRQVEVGRQRLSDLRAHGVHRVQARHRVLEDHPDLLAPHRAELPVGHRQQVLAGKHGRTGRYPSSSREDAQESE